MSHHKRGRPKHQRAGCLMCKPHKDERDGGPAVQPLQEQRALDAERLDFAGHEIASRWGDDSGIEYGECTCAGCRPALPQWGQAGSARLRPAPPQADPVQPLTDRPFARLL